MWILSFTRWGYYYLCEQGMVNHELERLSQSARELATIRPLIEWRSEGVGKKSEISEFLDQVEALLASSNELKPASNTLD